MTCESSGVDDGRVGVVTAAQEKERRTGPQPRAWTLMNNNCTLLITFPCGSRTSYLVLRRMQDGILIELLLSWITSIFDHHRHFIRGLASDGYPAHLENVSDSHDVPMTSGSTRPQTQKGWSSFDP